MCAQRVWRIAASQDALQGADRKRCASAEAAAPRVFGKSLQSAAIRLQCRADDIGQKLIIFKFENDAALLRAAAQRKCRVIEKRVCGQTGAEIAVKGDADVSGRVDERHAAVTHDLFAQYVRGREEPAAAARFARASNHAVRQEAACTRRA